MAKFKQKINCVYCEAKQGVTVITTMSKKSKSIKVKRCYKCGKQRGIKSILNKE